MLIFLKKYPSHILLHHLASFVLFDQKYELRV